MDDNYSGLIRIITDLSELVQTYPNYYQFKKPQLPTLKTSNANFSLVTRYLEIPGIAKCAALFIDCAPSHWHSYVLPGTHLY